MRGLWQLAGRISTGPYGMLGVAFAGGNLPLARALLKAEMRLISLLPAIQGARTSPSRLSHVGVVDFVPGLSLFLVSGKVRRLAFSHSLILLQRNREVRKRRSNRQCTKGTEPAPTPPAPLSDTSRADCPNAANSAACLTPASRAVHSLLQPFVSR